jgi:AcrR family transcriptional regulator
MSGADRRTQLLDLARDVVADEGFSGLTIDRIARAAAVTRTVVYQHFTDLAGLMDALLDRESATAFAGMSSVDWTGPDGADGADVTERVGRGILAYLQAAPTSWRIILRPPDGAPPELRSRIEIGRAYARKVAARHLSREIGVIVDPDGATERILLAGTEELARLHLEDPDRYSDDVVLCYLHSLVAWAARIETAPATTGD